MAMEKRENSIKINFSILRKHDVSFTITATIDHRSDGGMSDQKFTAMKIIRITWNFAPKNSVTQMYI